MSIEQYHALCAGLAQFSSESCDGPRELDSGVLACSLRWRGIGLDIVTHPSDGRGHAYVLANMGSSGCGGPDYQVALESLLEMNFIALGTHQPVFSKPPGRDELVLQWTFCMEDATPQSLWKSIEDGVELVLRWRGGFRGNRAAPGQMCTADLMNRRV